MAEYQLLFAIGLLSRASSCIQHMATRPTDFDQETRGPGQS